MSSKGKLLHFDVCVLGLLSLVAFFDYIGFAFLFALVVLPCLML